MDRIAQSWLRSYIFLLLAALICFFSIVWNNDHESLMKLSLVLCLFFIPNIFLFASYVHQCFSKLYRYELKWQYAILFTAWCNICLLGFVFFPIYQLAGSSIYDLFLRDGSPPAGEAALLAGEIICGGFLPVVLISLPIVFVIKKWRELKTERVRTTQADNGSFERLSTEKDEPPSCEIQEKGERKNHLTVSFRGLLILWGVAVGAFYSGIYWADHMLSWLPIICVIVNYGLSIEVMRRFMQRSSKKFDIKEMVMITILWAHSLVLMCYIPVSIIAIVLSLFVCTIMLCGSPVCFGGDETDNVNCKTK